MAASLGVSYEGSEPLEILCDIAQAADAAGARTLWAASHLFLREPIASAAMMLANTRRLGAALMAMSPYTVHPVYATMAAATLDEWFPGRVQLCFGSGAPRDLESIGLAADKPLGALRESMTIARALLSGDRVSFAGERFEIKERRLVSGRHDIPIFLAASRPKMLELAGAEADGVLISAATSPAFINWASAHVRVGEQRNRRRIRKSALVYASIGEDGRTARDVLRRNLAFILRGEHHAQNLRLTGTSLDQAALTAAFAKENWAHIDTLVDDAVVANHSISGTPAEAKSMMTKYENVGLDEIVIAGVKSGASLAAVMSALR
ncbi:MAG: LLM class flavin-dependent oxidoreductase [Methylobacteriaceae bacterium]|nr:LLM class flavin-dependent oxidoreductase [Methylobacteriaceae bacterium]